MGYKRLSDVNIMGNIGETVYVTCIVKNVDVRPMKNGGESMVFIMKDKDVEYDARVFGVSEELKRDILGGKVYDIEVNVKAYDRGKNGISCIVDNNGIRESQTKPEVFADWVDNLEVYYNKVSDMMQYVSDTKAGRVACKILTDNWEKFSTWPAATSMHHTSLGGLLMHTACVTDKCFRDGQYFNGVYGREFINIKLLVSAALIHDVMKIREYDVDFGEGSVEYSKYSSLETHIVGVASEVKLVAREMDIEQEPEILELQHCLLSHHGKLEWGSPIKPNMPEAVLLHNADMVDSELWKFNKVFKELTEQQSKSEWIRGEMKVYYRPTMEIQD